MGLTLTRSYNENGGNVLLRGCQETNQKRFINYLLKELHNKIEYYLGKTVVLDRIKTLDKTGFQDNVLTRVSEITKGDWGEFLTYDYLDVYLGIKIPWSPHWDKRGEKHSLPGADIIGLKYYDGNVSFAFGEIKTSSQEGTPDIIRYGDDCLINQLKGLTNIEKRKKVVQWFLLRSSNQSWQGDFDKALSYYIEGEHNYSIIGVLVKDTPPDILDLKCVTTALSDVKVRTSIHGIYIPININQCISIYKSGCERNAA